MVDYKNNIIATWIYEDSMGDETDFPQSGLLSSSEEHKAIYWRCVYMFFVFAKKYMPNNPLVLFTNFRGKIKIVDGVNVIDKLVELGVSFFIQDFSYKLPKGYYGSWGNQLYEFDIFKCFLENFSCENLLMLDSDCIITQDISALFEMLEKYPAITFRGEYKNVQENTLINGITEKDLTQLYNDVMMKLPSVKNILGGGKPRVNYLCGEFFCATYDFIKNMLADFDFVYNDMVNRFLQTQNPATIKCNEEAHFLSLFYAYYDIPVGTADAFIKRMWTSPEYFQIKDGDENFPIWHVLSGKRRYPKLIKIHKKLLTKNQEEMISELKNLFFVKDNEFVDDSIKNNSVKSVLKKILKKIGIFNFAKKMYNRFRGK